MLNPRRLYGPDEIRCLRADIGYPQERLANECGVAISLVQTWERGKHRPARRDVLDRLPALWQQAGLPPLRVGGGRERA